MIPTETQSKALWDKYTLPEKKRVHVMWVAKVAMFLAHQLRMKNPSTTLGTSNDVQINEKLLLAGCLLHDLDKNIPREAGEMHPETAVRILKQEGMEEVAELIKNHSVQCIDNDKTAPKTWEEKLLFLSDKMVKQEVITVDTRFALWLSEDDLPEEQKAMLRRVFPKVKTLEREIFFLVGIACDEVVQYL
jgi:putative nucleotidyltransferase with HDIG domain